MKVFFAILQAIILGIITWIIFSSLVNKYKGLATAEPTTLAQKYFEDTSKNSTDDKGQQKYLNVEAAQEDAERDIAIGKKIQATGGMELNSKRLMITVAISVLGFVGWFIAYFIVYITTYPLQVVLDSIWGNFVRFFLGPTAAVSILGGLIASLWADHMIRSLDVSSAISQNVDAASSNVGITTSESKVAQPNWPANRQYSNEVKQAPAIGNDIRAAKESVSENPITNELIPNNSSNVLPSGEAKSGSTENAAIAQARQELEREKIKLERERIEFEREKIRIQSSSVSSPRASNPTIEDAEIFVTSITKNDLYNSKGVRITDPVLVLMQDRANVHRFGNPDDDQVDQFFSLADNRARIRTHLSRGSFPQDVRNAITNADGRKFRINVYKDGEDKNCVDVSFANELNPNGTNGASNAASGKNLDGVVVYELIDSESNIREGPGANYPIIRQSYEGEQGQLVEGKSPWFKLRFGNNSQGWVHKQNIRLIVRQ
jgi:hypothetical protein